MVANRKPSRQDRERVLPLVKYFKSLVGFDRTLRNQHPALFEYLLHRLDAGRKRWRQEGLDALIETANAKAPTAQELRTAFMSHALRKALRDRFLKAMAQTYDEYFPKAGGRSSSAAKAHQFATAKEASTWKSVRQRHGQAAVEDQPRKLVERDQEKVAGACLQLLKIAGPSSDAPTSVKAEFAVLFEKAVQTANGKKSRRRSPQDG